MSYSTGKVSELPQNFTKNRWVVADLEPVNMFKDEYEKMNSPRFAFSNQPEVKIDNVLKHKVKEKSTKKLLTQFAKTTSGHGFSRIVDPHEKPFFRGFWAFVLNSFLVVLLATILIITYEAFVVRQQRREYIVHHNTSMYLPDIHICDNSLFKKSALKGIFLYFIILVKLKPWKKFRT